MNAMAQTQATMRAAVITGPGELVIKEVPRPIPGNGQVRIRLEGCGVCASNLVPWSGPSWMQFPTQPGSMGHEGWGVIDAVGPNVGELQIGQRVAALSHNSYAEYDIADANQIVPVPEALRNQPAPGEPLGCAFNIFRRADIAAGQSVAIVGIGFLGAILTRLAVDAGARVIAISRREFSLDVARRMGAQEVLASSDPGSVISAVSKLTAGKLCERTIEAVGNQSALDLATELTGVRGRLVIAGYHQDGPRTVNMQLWNWRGLDVINAHERDAAAYAQGVKEAFAAIEQGRVDPSSLYSHAYPLEQLDRALDAARDRPDGFLKAIVTLT
jgi:threonine dehydrogenase-like Zn-dependent dehydrogenase